MVKVNQFPLAHYRMITDRKIKGHIECIGKKTVRKTAALFCDVQRYTLVTLKLNLPNMGERIGNCRKSEIPSLLIKKVTLKVCWSLIKDFYTILEIFRETFQNLSFLEFLFVLILSTSLHEDMRFFFCLSGIRLLPNIIRLQEVMCVPTLVRTEILSDYFFLFSFFFFLFVF